ncbi:MAG TPA: serine hydrolase [Gemmatimonadota bacterium]|nr:serine hydrolase [Gemmatimonadota bacterium]
MTPGLPHRARRHAAAAALAAVLVAVAAVPAAAQSAAADTAPAAAHWEGSILTPGSPLEIAVDLWRRGGAWSGTIDIPAQGVTGRPVSDLAVEGDSVRFGLEGVAGSPVFRGRVTAGGDSLSGTFTQGRLDVPFHLARTGPPAAARALPSPEAALEGFGDFVRSSLRSWKVPGAAVAIVADGKVVLEQGYGLRDVEGGDPVTAHTGFPIGSTTKAFTALLVGTLVDDGLLDWDTPVRTWLPSFRMEDEFATERMTPRDLLTHRSGLPRHDLLWYGSDLSRPELIRRLRWLEPSEDFRTHFQYQNLMYVTAGWLAGQVTGSTWEAQLRARILGPLAMEETSLSVDSLRATDDHALGYELKPSPDDSSVKAPVRMPYRDIDAIGPAGSINSTAHDMARWLRFQLGNGSWEGRSIVTRATLEETHRPQVVVDSKVFRLLLGQPEMPDLDYGSGWFVQTFRGHRFLHHGGNIDGFSAEVGFLPDLGIGVVVLSNLNGTELPVAVELTALDRLLGTVPADWNGRFQALQERAEAARERSREGAAAGTGAAGLPATHPRSDYAGTYADSAYGPLRISADSVGLRVSYHSLSSRLEHVTLDVWRATDDPLKGITFQFGTDLRGRISTVSAPMDPAVPAVSFGRRAPERMRDPAWLQRYVGIYDLQSFQVVVALRGDHLVLETPGQPLYELVPRREDVFDLRGLSGYSARFVEKDGKVAAVLLEQPRGTFRAERAEQP